MKSKDKKEFKEVKLVFNKDSAHIISDEEGMYAEYVSHRNLRYKKIKVIL